MNERRSHLQTLLAALADPSRFQILCELADGPRHVSDLATSIGLSQSCTTRHVQALVRVGGVECRRAGKRVMVQIRMEDECTRAVLGWIAVSATEEPAISRARTETADLGPARSKASDPPKRSKPRPARKERPPADPVDSGTPDSLSERPTPLMAPRRAALEDFLL